MSKGLVVLWQKHLSFSWSDSWLAVSDRADCWLEVGFEELSVSELSDMTDMSEESSLPPCQKASFVLWQKHFSFSWSDSWLAVSEQTVGWGLGLGSCPSLISLIWQTCQKSNRFHKLHIDSCSFASLVPSVPWHSCSSSCWSGPTHC